MCDPTRPQSFIRWLIVTAFLSVVLINLNVTRRVSAQSGANCVTLRSGLLTWLRAEGNASDSTGVNQPTREGNTTFTSTTDGRVNQAFVFDGDGDFVIVPDDSARLNPRHAITLAAWVFPTRAVDGDIISKDGETSDRQYLLGSQPTGRFRAHVGVEGGFRFVDSATVAQLNTWYHVAMSYDGTTLKLYVNGVLDGSLAVTGDIITTSEPVRVGGGAPSGRRQNFYFGRIDEAQIYDRAVPQAEIQSIVNNNSAGSCTPGTIRGRLKTINGKSIPNISIRLSGDRSEEQFTNESGEYSFRHLNVGSSYTVRPSGSGSTSGWAPDNERIFSPFPGGISGADFESRIPHFQIVGLLQNAPSNVRNVVEVRVEGTNIPPNKYKCIVQNNGAYTCDNLTVTGNYTIRPQSLDGRFIFNPLFRTLPDTEEGLVTNLGSLNSACDPSLKACTNFLTITSPPNTVQFNAASQSVGENIGSAVIPVTRSGDISAAATIFYSTAVDAQVLRCDFVTGAASERCDYITALGTLSFAPGQNSANISILIIDDAYAEGSENIQLSLSDPAGLSLGTTSTITLTIQDNDAASSFINPIDTLSVFVRQQYLDFLSREPDGGGFDGWIAKLNQCPPEEHGNRFYPQDCTRIDVSASFFRSQEFQQKGYYVYRFYAVSFGRRPTFAEFIPDMVRVTGQTDAEFIARRNAFPAEWVERQAFRNKHDLLSTAQYVDELLRVAGVTQQLAARRDGWIGGLQAGTKTRAQVLREIIETPEVDQKFFNEAFVAMQYFGYLRRDPDEAGYRGWLDYLNRTGNFREMVWGFLYSPEHKLRFGPVPGF